MQANQAVKEDFFLFIYLFFTFPLNSIFTVWVEITP